MITRTAALDLVVSGTPGEHMLRHAEASEAVMRALAEYLGEDAELS